MTFAYRDGVLCADEIPLDSIADASARRATCTRARRSKARTASSCAPWMATPPRVLFGQGQFQSLDPAASRASRRRLRHRLGRRARARSRCRRRSGQDAFFRRRQERSGNSARAGEADRLHQRRVRGRARARRRSSARPRPARADRLRVNPDIDRAHPSLHLDRAAREQVRRRPRRRRAALPGSGGLPGIEWWVSAATSARSSSTAAPFVAAARALVALVDRLEARGIAAAPHRCRRRHRHPLPRRDAASRWPHSSRGARRRARRRRQTLDRSTRAARSSAMPACCLRA